VDDGWLSDIVRSFRNFGAQGLSPQNKTAEALFRTAASATSFPAVQQVAAEARGTDGLVSHLVHSRRMGIARRGLVKQNRIFRNDR
jgi:hypothetical protein